MRILMHSLPPTLCYYRVLYYSMGGEKEVASIYLDILPDTHKDIVRYAPCLTGSVLISQNLPENDQTLSHYYPL